MPLWDESLPGPLPPDRARRRLSFQVHGHPAAQGSKTPWGTEANKKLAPWRNDIKVACFDAMRGDAPWREPVALRAVFIFPRPASHYGTGRNAGQVKRTAPGWKTSTPDLDKLVRALGDALTGVAIHDDALIVDCHVVKIWGQTPGVQVTLLAV